MSPLFRSALVALVTLVLLAPGVAGAQRLSVGVAGGAALSVGRFGDATETSPAGLLIVGLKGGYDPYGLRFEALVAPFRAASGAAGSTLGDARVTAYTLNVTVDLPGETVRPYVIVGGGYYGLAPDTGATRSGFGANGGIGFRAPIGPLATFIEARYHHGFTTGTPRPTFIPFMLGLSI